MKFIVSRTSGDNLKIKTKELVAKRRGENNASAFKKFKVVEFEKFEVVEVETLEQLLNIMEIEKELEIVIGKTAGAMSLAYENLPKYFIEIYDDYRE